MNVPIKVQTNGAGGVKNRLTDEDIKDATAIIVAADVNVRSLAHSKANTFCKYRLDVR